MSQRLERYRDFWMFYLGEHSRPATRSLHFIGTITAVLILVTSFVVADWRIAIFALVIGYVFAWSGHYFFEGNKPATFKYPIWSLISGFRMLGLWLVGRLSTELNRNFRSVQRRNPERSGR